MHGNFTYHRELETNARIYALGAPLDYAQRKQNFFTLIASIWYAIRIDFVNWVHPYSKCSKPMLFQHGTRATGSEAPPTVCDVFKRATAVFYFTYDANEISKMKVAGAFNRACTRLMLKKNRTCATEASEWPYSISTASLHREQKFNWIKEISAYEIFMCRRWKNLFDSMISSIWMTTESMKFSDLESIKILFEPTKRICLVKRLKNTIVLSQNNTMAQ